MKKFLMVIFLSLLILCAVFAGDSTSKTASSKAKISEDIARQTALQHAGLTKNQVGFLSSKIKNENGALKYNVTFIYNNTEYEYKIDADTGKVLSFNKDYKYYPTIPVSQSSEKTQSQSVQQTPQGYTAKPSSQQAPVYLTSKPTSKK